MNITKRTKSEGTTVYQFRVFLSQSADGKQRTRSKTWQPPAGMTAKAAEKEAKRQAVIFENEVKQGRAALDARTKLSDVAREYIRNTEMEYKTKEWYEYMLRVVEDDIGNMPISALKAYQIERIYADMREPDAKRTYCVTATELDKIRKEKGMSIAMLAEKAGVEMPITFGAYEVLYEGKDPHEVLRQLMSRQRKDELELEESWI